MLCALGPCWQGSAWGEGRSPSPSPGCPVELHRAGCSEGPAPSSMLCCRHLKILNFLTRAPVLLLLLLSCYFFLPLPPSSVKRGLLFSVLATLRGTQNYPIPGQALQWKHGVLTTGPPGKSKRGLLLFFPFLCC